MDTTTAKRAYRFRFYPTPEQEQTLRRTLGCCRKVYNMALDARSEAWTVRHESVSYEDTSRMLTDWKKTKDYAYLREVSSVVMVLPLSVMLMMLTAGCPFRRVPKYRPLEWFAASACTRPRYGRWDAALPCVPG